MFIRKQHIFTEQRVYPLVTKDDLRLDLLPRVRNMTRARNGNHPWLSMSDDELLASAQLTGRDYETGRDGFKAAAVLLLGKDQVIGSLFPAYKTDALLRRVNVERYDDRDTVSTNLIESWERLLAFGQKHLNDKFFNNICRADELGSGVRNLYRDVRRYSGADPIFDEGDVFTLTIPLKDMLPAAGQESAPVGNEPTPQLEASTPQVTPQVEECTPQVSAAVKRALLVLSSGELSSNDLLVELGLKDRKAMQERYVITALEAGLIERTQANVHAPNQKYRLTESGRRLLDAL